MRNLHCIHTYTIYIMHRYCATIYVRSIGISDKDKQFTLLLMFECRELHRIWNNVSGYIMEFLGENIDSFFYYHLMK